MDVELQEAACQGDVRFLRQAVATKRSEYFLSRLEPERSCNNSFAIKVGNIIHLATLHNKQDFIKEAIKSLPHDHLHFLFTQQEPSSNLQNPLHFAAKRGYFEIIKLILGFYRTSKNDVGEKEKPWLARDADGDTPLHLLSSDVSSEECALEILSMDMDILCCIEGKDGVSPLYAAVWQGYNRVALKIMTYAESYSLRGPSSLNPLNILPESSEEVGMVLLDKHPELLKGIDNETNKVIHSWARAGKLWPFQCLSKMNNNKLGQHWRSYIVSQLHTTETFQHNNPLHCAATSTRRSAANGDESVQVMQFLVDAYKQETNSGGIRHEEPSSSSSLRSSKQLPPPWYMLNDAGKTPLHLAIERNEKMAIYLLSVMDSPQLLAGNNPLFLALGLKRQLVVEKILGLMEEEDGWRDFVYNNGRNILHQAANHCNEHDINIVTILMDKLPQHINECDITGKTPLEVAAASYRSDWLVKCLLSKDPSAIKRAPLSWIEPCKRGYVSTINTFIEHCPNFRELCLELKDTPLHHIQLRTSKEYLDFLQIPLIRGIKNVVDSNGSTPLHRAIERKDMAYVEALLITNWVFKNIKDRNGKTAMDLLAELCHQDEAWNTLYEKKHMKLPTKPTGIIQPHPSSLTRTYWHPMHCFRDGERKQRPYSGLLIKLKAFNKKSGNQLEEEVVELLKRLKENMTKEEVHDLLVADEAPLSCIVQLFTKQDHSSNASF